MLCKQWRVCWNNSASTNQHGMYFPKIFMCSLLLSLSLSPSFLHICFLHSVFITPTEMVKSLRLLLLFSVLNEEGTIILFSLSSSFWFIFHFCTHLKSNTMRRNFVSAGTNISLLYTLYSVRLILFNVFIFATFNVSGFPLVVAHSRFSGFSNFI